MLTIEINGIGAAIGMLDIQTTAIQHGTNVAINQLGNLGVRLGRPMIPADSGETRQRLAATYQRLQGEITARVAVRGNRRHIMRFLEGGTKSHGRGGGPLPAHHIMEHLRQQLELLAGPTVEVAIHSQLK
jgi:hypothetical protein